MEGKSDHSKSNNQSFLDKTNTKTTKKHAIGTYQSISLDNSLNKDSPSVSCFLKDCSPKVEVKPQNKKKGLTIDTDQQQTLLRF